ncbi:hypothetical protein GCM10010172_58890 [Paractinoplanes ferrugineus]|uniref:Subtilisin inhibitor domain-containing protein n=1 Tax=Paractinoplanes ferrugineus TaxID=113564 RepID=A0A919J6T6_9ACTN|nr:SSI family serine proteinase inhibitor [Actinoplanes ferrugineus]GIE14352.1 hypothetical protein Afe05nite_61920 [Actinoplanes ferrugineus]
MISTIAGLAASAVVLVVPGPRDHPGGYASTRLTLSYTAEAGFADVVKLECDPPAGGHPHPGLACAELARVAGRPDRIAPGHHACFLIYQPVTAEIAGQWRGTALTWSHKFGNMCEMRRATGDLFDF